MSKQRRGTQSRQVRKILVVGALLFGGGLAGDARAECPDACDPACADYDLVACYDPNSEFVTRTITQSGGTISWSASLTCSGPGGTGPNSCTRAGTTLDGPVINGYHVQLQRATSCADGDYVDVDSAVTSGGSTGSQTFSNGDSGFRCGTFGYRLRHQQEFLLSDGSGNGSCTNAEAGGPSPAVCKDWSTRNDNSDGFACVTLTVPGSLSCPAPIVRECTGPSTNTVTYSTPAAACGGAVSCSPPSGSSFGVVCPGDAATTVACSETGSNGCDFSVKVQDSSAPTISCPANVGPIECNGGSASPFTATADSGAATASDLCSTHAVAKSPTTSTFSLTPGQASTSTTVTHTATDACNNASSCTNTVTVVDTQPPLLSGVVATQTVLGSCAGTAVSLPTPPTALDACQGAVSVSCGTVAGNSFGANSVTCTATDHRGLSSSVTITLNILEPLRLAFRPPLSDDNAANDIGSDADINNLFRVNQTIPHKVKLYSCDNTDVTSVAPVTAHLSVSAGINGGGTPIINDLEDFNGIGDVSGLMTLTDGQYHYNLETNGADYGSGGQYYQSVVVVRYLSAPTITAGIEDARLKSR